MAYQQTEVEELWRRMQQFLIHSFCYYNLNENMISDHDYDYLCKRMVELIQKYPKEASSMPYFNIVGGADSSGSGFYIKDYPPAIQSTAYKMLWYHKKQTLPDFKEDFVHFISRWGGKVER